MFIIQVTYKLVCLVLEGQKAIEYYPTVKEIYIDFCTYKDSSIVNEKTVRLIVRFFHLYLFDSHVSRLIWLPFGFVSISIVNEKTVRFVNLR